MKNRHSRVEKRQILIYHLLILILAGSTVAAGTETVLSTEQTLNRFRIGDLRLSPDGSRIAMVVTEPVKGTTRDSDIWVYYLDLKALMRFTTSEKSDNNPRWSPDGKILAFLSNRAEKTQIFLISVGGGEAEAVTENDTGVRSFEWSPDGRHIVYLAAEPKTDEEKKKEEEKDDARVVDKDDRHARLWLMDVETRETRLITPSSWRISEWAWMPGGERLILSATDHPQPELETNRLFTLRISDGSMDEIAAPPPPFGRIEPSPDGKFLAYTATRGNGPTEHDLYVLSLADGAMKNLTHQSIDRPIGGFRWRGSNALLAQAANGFTGTFYSVALDGKAKPLKPFPVHPGGAFVADENILAFVGETTSDAPEVWLSEKEGRAEKITHFNAAWDTIEVVIPEIITYESIDGTSIEASLFMPPGAENSWLPLIVLVHGGPSGRWSDGFRSWSQLLVARGFAVLCPNIRGSIGYGHDFLAMNRRDWGGRDFDDVMAGVDHLIRKKIADPDRLGIGGWSYGGYMAAWAVTQTDRFRASVSGAPMTDLAFEYGAESASINAYDTWYMGTPYENLDLFIARSPTTFVKNVKTPTLILCGENDATDPVEQCRMFYRGLKRYGVDTELVIYPREGHGLREEKHQIDMLNRMIAWFERHLK